MKKYLALLLATACVHAETPPSEAPSSRVNYPANFQVEKGIDLFVFGDYLYWIAQEDDLYFAQMGNSLKKVSPSFNSGFRAGLGLNFPRSGIEISTYWTSFTTSADHHIHKTNQPFFAEPGFSSPLSASGADAHWKLRLNLIDLELSRASWFGGHFSLRPFLGLRAALIEQHLSSQFHNNSSPLSLSTIKTHCNFQGGGLRAGGEGRWTLGNHFALYGLTSLSLLYGEWHTRSTTSLDDIQIARTTDNTQHPLSSLQTLAGLSWDTHFAKDRLHLEFHIGWEQNLFFHFNRTPRYTGLLPQALFTQHNGNLSTQGLTLGGRFDF